MIQFDDAFDPRNFDILLTDINSNDIHEAIPKKLKIEYLLGTPKEFDGNIDGIVYGLHLRLFCATTIRIKDKIKIVTFLIDTGSSTTYISEEVLLAFGIEMADPVNDYMNVKINSRTARVMMSRSNFKEVCVMGNSFLSANAASMHVYFGSGVFYLNFDQELDKMNQSITHNPPPPLSTNNLRSEEGKGGLQIFNHKKTGSYLLVSITYSIVLIGLYFLKKH